MRTGDLQITKSINMVDFVIANVGLMLNMFICLQIYLKCKSNMPMWLLNAALTSGEIFCMWLAERGLVKGLKAKTGHPQKETYLKEVLPFWFITVLKLLH